MVDLALEDVGDARSARTLGAPVVDVEPGGAEHLEDRHPGGNLVLRSSGGPVTWNARSGLCGACVIAANRSKKTVPWPLTSLPHWPRGQRAAWTQGHRHRREPAPGMPRAGR